MAGKTRGRQWQTTSVILAKKIIMNSANHKQTIGADGETPRPYSDSKATWKERWADSTKIQRHEATTLNPQGSAGADTAGENRISLSCKKKKCDESRWSGEGDDAGIWGGKKEKGTSKKEMDGGNTRGNGHETGATEGGNKRSGDVESAANNDRQNSSS